MMFENWTIIEWGILVFDIIAVSVAVWFLRKKIKSKFVEVEARHAFETRRRKNS